MGDAFIENKRRVCRDRIRVTTKNELAGTIIQIDKEGIRKLFGSRIHMRRSIAFHPSHRDGRHS